MTSFVPANGPPHMVARDSRARLAGSQSRVEPCPHVVPPIVALLWPIAQPRDRPQIPLGKHILARSDWRQVQNFFLNVRSQMQEIHDLRHARLRDVGEACEVGHVGDGAIIEHLVEADRQGHQFGDARSSASPDRRLGRRARPNSPWQKSPFPVDNP